VQKEKEKKEKEKKENREEGFIEMSSNQRGGCGRDRTTRRGCEKFECIS
jgi:hypothetical protein